MSAPFVAEVRIFGFNFPPTGWAYCNGQLLPISQNTALFALLGTNYGGDGKSTFALPDMQGSVMLGAGQSPGTSNYFPGELGGVETVTLLSSEMPIHTHSFNVDPDDPGEKDDPTNFALARGELFIYHDVAGATLQPMALQSLSPAGGSLPHNNMMPYLTMNMCIAMQGVFPARN